MASVPPSDRLLDYVARNESSDESSDISECYSTDRLVELAEDFIQRGSSPARSPGRTASQTARRQRRVTKRLMRRQRMTPREKLQGVVDYLRSIQWSFRRLMIEWIKGQDNYERKLASKNYATVTARREVLRDTFRDSEIMGTLEDLDGTTVFDVALIIQELDALPPRSERLFGKWTSSHTILDDLDFASASDIIRETAPSWYTLILSLLRNQRAL